MRVVVPYTPIDPKSRLSPVLTGDERHAFSRVMLTDVLAAIRATGHTPEILSTTSLPAVDAPVHVDNRQLSDAVNAMLTPPMAVVMADLALLTPDAVRATMDCQADVVIGPGRGGGTNLLIVRADGYMVDYHGNSLADHRRMAKEAGLEIAEIDSFRIATDVDEPSDLVEVLLHATGRARDWLIDHGFYLAETNGRVAIDRE